MVENEYKNNGDIISEINLAISSILRGYNAIEKNEGNTKVSDKFDENTSFGNEIDEPKSLVNRITNNSITNKKSSKMLNDSISSCQKIRNIILDNCIESQNFEKNIELENIMTKNEEKKTKITDTVNSTDRESYTVFEIYEDKIISKTNYFNSNDKKDENIIFQYQINL